MRAGALVALLVSEGVKHHTGNLAEVATQALEGARSPQAAPVPPRFAAFMARMGCEHLSQEFCHSARNPWCGAAFVSCSCDRLAFEPTRRFCT